MNEQAWKEQAARIIEERVIGCCIPSQKDAADLARDLYPLVQQAIAAERERCAKVAKNWPDRYEGAGIAHAIRSLIKGE